MASTSVTFRGNCAGWLPGGEMVVIGDAVHEFAGAMIGGLGALGIYDLERSERTRILTDGDDASLGSSYGQVAIDATGTRLVYLQTDDSGALRIVELSLRDGALRTVADSGAGGRYQWPVFAPDGRAVAYLGYAPAMELRVEERTVFRWREDHVGADAFAWISSTAIAVAAGDSLYVVDATSGAIRGEPVSIPERVAAARRR